MIRREPRSRLGEYVLVARLSEDALGAVYRAIHARDGRFARLRVLESRELDRNGILRAVSRIESLHRKRSVHPPGRRETLAIADGRPYLAWHETSGWTLDTVLEATRARGAPLPIDGALRIAAGVAAALEHVRSNAVAGEPAHHGLLWPGFVTVSRNAEVWVRGFGLASAVFPELPKPGLTRILGPYVAPEVRSNGAVGEQSDIYSLGVLLAELLTARPACLEGAPPLSLSGGPCGPPNPLAPDDPFSKDVARLAKALLAEPAERPRSVRAVRLRLQRLLEDCPYERSNADLALDLDDLLKPENGARGPRAIARVFPLSRPWPRSAEPGATRSIWALRIAGGIAAVLLLAVVDLAVRTREVPRGSAIRRARIALTRLSSGAPPPSTAPVAASAALSDSSSTTAADRQRPRPSATIRGAAGRALRHERQLAQL